MKLHFSVFGRSKVKPFVDNSRALCALFIFQKIATVFLSSPPTCDCPDIVKKRFDYLGKILKFDERYAARTVCYASRQTKSLVFRGQLTSHVNTFYFSKNSYCFLSCSRMCGWPATAYKTLLFFWKNT